MFRNAFRHLYFSNDAGNPVVLPVSVPATPALQTAFRLVTIDDVIKPPPPIFHDVRVAESAFHHCYSGDRDVVLKQDLFIKAAGTDIYVPEQLKEAVPFISDVFRIQCEQGYDVSDLWAQMFITQGYVEPRRTLAATMPHIDMNLGRVLRGTHDNARHYLASNIFTTELFDQPVKSLSPDIKFCDRDELSLTFARALRAHAASTTPVFADPYQIAEAESVMVHAECIADFRAYRTFMMIAMRSDEAMRSVPKANLGMDINNAALFQALAPHQR